MSLQSRQRASHETTGLLAFGPAQPNLQKTPSYRSADGHTPFRKPNLQSVFGHNTGFFGEFLQRNGVAQKVEWLDASENSREHQEYRQLLEEAFGANPAILPSARARLNLLEWRAKSIAAPQKIGGKELIHTIHSSLASPNTYFLDKLQELNFLRVLKVIERDDFHERNQYLFSAWASDLCSSEDWAFFGLPNFRPEELSAAIDTVKKWSADPAQSEQDSIRIGTFNYLLELALPDSRRRMSGGAALSIDGTWNYSDSKGGY